MDIRVKRGTGQGLHARMKGFERYLEATSDGRSVEAHLFMLVSHMQKGLRSALANRLYPVFLISRADPFSSQGT
jgi:hypothetical protein